MDQDEHTEARRAHVRTTDNIPVYYEPFDEDSGDEQEVQNWEVMFDEIEPTQEENPKLYELLFDINQKLNLLVKQASDKSGFNMPEAREVSISGGGLMFYSKEDHKAGDKLVLKTFLPIYAHVIKIKCEVVRSIAREGGGYDVAVKYLDMDEVVRDKIIKYIFAKQRKSLRSEKREEYEE